MTLYGDDAKIVMDVAAGVLLGGGVILLVYICFMGAFAVSAQANKPWGVSIAGGVIAVVLATAFVIWRLVGF